MAFTHGIYNAAQRSCLAAIEFRLTPKFSKVGCKYRNESRFSSIHTHYNRKGGK